MRLLAPLLLLAISPALQSCARPAAAQDDAGPRLSHQHALVDWSKADLSYVSADDRFAASRAICARYIAMEPPARDWPRLADVDLLAGCDSFNLAHDIGGPPDYARARHCALIERETMGRELDMAGNDSRPVLEGPGLLAVLYANGLGVPRNLPVAIHLACEMNGAPFEMDGRITRMEEMRTSGWQGSDFDPCDDMTSGYGAGQCSTYAARLADSARHDLIMQASQGWPVAWRQALAGALDAFETYATTANASNCAGGTLAAACRTAGTQDMQQRFSDRLLAIAAHRPPPRAVPSGGDGEYVWSRVATMPQAEWEALLGEVPRDERDQYHEHRFQTVTARNRFEPRLIAFLRLARPDLSAHQVRVLFRDL